MSHASFSDPKSSAHDATAQHWSTPIRSACRHYEIDADHDSGLIEVKIKGFWTIEIATTYLAEIVGTLSAARRRGRAILLVDLTESAVQSVEVMQKLCSLDMYAEDDRVAVVVASTLLKTQLKRVFTNANMAVFTSPFLAKTWAIAP